MSVNSHHELVKNSYQDTKIAEEYDSLRFTSFFGSLSNKRDIGMILSALSTHGISSDSKLLDVACGTGRITQILATKYSHVEGCDGSEEMMTVARSKDELQNISFHVGDATALPFEDNSFECVTSIRFIGHLNRADCDQVFSEMGRVSSDLVVFDLSIDNVFTRARRKIKRLIRGSYLKFDKQWSWEVFEKADLINRLNKSGLDVIELKSKLPIWSDAHLVVCKPFSR